MIEPRKSYDCGQRITPKFFIRGKADISVKMEGNSAEHGKGERTAPHRGLRAGHELKIVQRGVEKILEAIYEQDFYDYAHGYRKGHSPHQAIKQVWEKSQETKVNWIIDAEVSGIFDAIPQNQ